MNGLRTIFMLAGGALLLAALVPGTVAYSMLRLWWEPRPRRYPDYMHDSIIQVGNFTFSTPFEGVLWFGGAALFLSIVGVAALLKGIERSPDGTTGVAGP